MVTAMHVPRRWSGFAGTVGVTSGQNRKGSTSAVRKQRSLPGSACWTGRQRVPIIKEERGRAARLHGQRAAFGPLPFSEGCAGCGCPSERFRGPADHSRRFDAGCPALPSGRGIQGNPAPGGHRVRYRPHRGRACGLRGPSAFTVRALRASLRASNTRPRRAGRSWRRTHHGVRPPLSGPPGVHA